MEFNPLQNSVTAIPNANFNYNNVVAIPHPNIANNSMKPPSADYVGTVERILSQVEYRGEVSYEPLTRNEISALSELCSFQATTASMDDMGFADVDPDLTGQLVEYLEKHIAAAASVDIVRESLTTVHKIKRGEAEYTFDQWLNRNGASRLQTLRAGLEAASIVLFIINSPGIDRRVVNEDAIEVAITLFRHNLSKNILPALNNVGHIDHSKAKPEATPTASAKKRRRGSTATDVAAIIREMRKVYRHVLHTIGITVLVMERLDMLIEKVPLDDQQLLAISSGSMLSLELDPINDSAIKATHQLHVATLGVVTSIFRKYPRHRQIIIEDLFPIMLRMPTSKKSMRTYPVRCSSVLYPGGLQSLSRDLAPGNTDPNYIQTISAMILSLVQSSVTRPALEEQTDVGMQAEADEEDISLSVPKFLSGLRDCRTTSDLFVSHLIQRCARKGEDGGASEFRPILSNLIDDLLFVVLIPEYPAAEMILMSIGNLLSTDMLKASHPKAIHNVEATYLTTACDALGKICAAEARILKANKDNPVRSLVAPRQPDEKYVGCYCSRNEFDSTFMLSCDRCYCWYHGSCVGLSRDTIPSEWHCDPCQLSRIVEFEQDRNTNMGEMGCPMDLIDDSYCMRRLLIDYLSIVSRKTGLTRVRDAYEFHLARWINEISPTGKEVPDPNIRFLPLIARLLEFWDPNESSSMSTGKGATLSGMLHCLSDEGRSRIVIHLASTQSNLMMSFRTQVGLIVNLMESDSSALLRKLAVKAVEKVTEADRGYMTHPIIKKTVIGRFSDEAISVREAAVSLVGSYVLHLPAVANDFHPAFMVGLNDLGVSVRKRTIKILQDILCSNPMYQSRAAACSEMLRLAADPKEDDGVRDLIYDLFLSLWLENGGARVVQVQKSPLVTPDIEEEIKTPGVYVEGLEETNVVAGVLTPMPKQPGPFTPTPAAKSTRSTARKINSRRAQIRSEIAAEQMVEVVKTSGSGEGLTSLFRELLQGVSDTDKDRKASDRKRRQLLAQAHCSMLVDALVEILLTTEENRESYSSIGFELVAIIRTISVFADVSPFNLVKHLDMLLPYLKADNGLRMQEESVIVSSLCHVLSQVSAVLEDADMDKLDAASLAADLAAITYKFGPKPCSAAVRALSSLSQHRYVHGESPFKLQILKLARTFYKYMMKNRDESKFLNKPKIKDHIKRALSVLGSICRYHETTEDEDLELDEDEEENPGNMELGWVNMIALCRRLFLEILETNDPQAKCAALEALCGVFIARPREMLYMNESGLITDVMAPTMHRTVQLTALRCWRDILLTEEARIESGEARRAMESKKSITLSKKISGDQDADATLFGGVLTSHASRLFEITQVRDTTLRFAALDLIGHLLRQGQVNPNDATPYLFALQGDVEEDRIRSLALKLLMIEGEKRPDMLRQRACAGVKQAYLFQKSVYPDKAAVSALVNVNTHGRWHKECILGRVYKECIQSIRKQRQGLFRNLLGLFSIEKVEKQEETNGKKSKRTTKAAKGVDLALLSFTAQVLAFLPFSASADPLYIIHCITSVLALKGPDLLDRLASFLRPYGFASSDEMDETNLGEDAIEMAAMRSNPRHAKEVIRLLEPDFDAQRFLELCSDAGALILLLRLKEYLKKCYNLSESRCLEYNPDAKERMAEKVIARAGSIVEFDSYLPLQVDSSPPDLDGMILQYAEFRRRMRAETSSDVRLDESDDEIEDTHKRKHNEIDDMSESD